MKPTIVPFIESQPELGLAGPILYRAYQTEQGIEALIDKKNRDRQEEEERKRAFDRASQNIAQQHPDSSWGTFIATPWRHRGTSATTEEKQPLLPTVTSQPVQQPIYHDDQDQGYIEINEEGEDIPLLGDTGMRQRQQTTTYHDDDDDEFHDVELGQPQAPQQPPQQQPQNNPNTTNRNISRGLAAGAGIAATTGIGIGTYVGALNRPVNVRIPHGPDPNPPVDPPPQPTNPPVVPTLPPSDPGQNPILYPDDHGDSNQQQPTPPPNIVPPTIPPTVPPTPPVPNDAMDLDDNEDTKEEYELVIVKEIKTQESTVPALLTGVAFGSLATLLFI